MKRIALLMAALLAAATIAACGNGNEPVSGGNAAPSAESEGAQAEAGAATPNPAREAESEGKRTDYPLTITDDSGVELTFDKAPERIVSTSPSETEILFALGLGDRVFGVSDYDNYPEEALDKPKVGGVTSPNAEAILAAEPDLVIGGISMKEQVVEEFRTLGMTLVKFEPKQLQDVLDNILLIGRITDTQSEAEKLVAHMQADIDRVKAIAAQVPEADRQKVYIEFSPGWTVGKGEFMDEMIALAGGINIAGETEGWSQINEEHVIQQNPDVILYTLGAIDEKSGQTIEELVRGRAGWEKIEAVANDRIVGIDRDLVSRPGPRITQGLLDFVEGIYPDLVQQ